MAMLQQDPSWKVVANDSVVASLVRSNAEELAETARYAEYQFKESKWDTAQNISSILAHANLIGYAPKRKISARGKIYISNSPLIHYVGRTISTEKFKRGINSWAYNKGLKVYSTSTISDSKGNPYVAIPTVLTANSPYTTLKIIQGERKTLFLDINTIRQTATVSKLDPYIYIPAVIRNCEAANNIESKQFFRVYAAYANESDLSDISYKEYRVVDSLLLSDIGDYDVEVYNDLYSRDLFYFKFNNDPQRGNVLNISQTSSLIGLKIDYLESKGAEGNLVNSFETFTIEGVYSPEDLSNKSYTLYGVNLEAIIGGAEEESVSEIKQKAPKNYITYYGAGTKEAYEQAVSSLTLNFTYNNTAYALTPKKVKVYGGDETTSGGTRRVTYITFLANNLEDLMNQSAISEDFYSTIGDNLELYLDNLKSPQDVLRFKAPRYIPFALSLTCTIDREGDSIEDNASNIRNYIEKLWGSNAEEQDFSRSFYPSQLTHNLMSNFSDLKSIKSEIEAIAKLDWASAERKSPNGDNSTNAIHTFRIPFKFDGIFLGKENTEGFKDHRVGAEYVMRVDFMYKKPLGVSSTSKYHVSLFIQENASGREHDAFYILNDSTTNSAIWPVTGSSSILPTADYSGNIGRDDVSRLTKSWQFRYKQEMYNDDEFRELIEDSENATESTLKSHLTNLGTIDDYIIYFDSEYSSDNNSAGAGFIEMSFDSIYSVLSVFASYSVDTTLKEKFSKCPLSILKCSTSSSTDGTNAFQAFKEIAAEYVDIYVSMRPNDENLLIESSVEDANNSVLYIDTSDTDGKLDEDKKPRMISLKFKYEE